MKLILTGKDFQLTQPIKEYVAKHAEKFERYRPDLRQLKFELDIDHRHRSGENFRAEAWAFVTGGIFEAGARGESMEAAIDGVVQKLGLQLRKAKEKKITKRRRSRL